MENSIANEVSIELLLELKAILFPDFKIGASDLIKLKRIIDLYGIRTKKELLNKSSLIAPVIVKNVFEQNLFISLIEKAKVDESAIDKVNNGTSSGSSGLNATPKIKAKKGTYVFYLLLIIALGIISIIYYRSESNSVGGNITNPPVKVINHKSDLSPKSTNVFLPQLFPIRIDKNYFQADIPLIWKVITVLVILIPSLLLLGIIVYFYYVT